MKKSWIAMLASFSCLLITTVVFYAAKDQYGDPFYSFLDDQKGSFLEKNMIIWTLLLLSLSAIGLFVSLIIIIMNANGNNSFNKIANYAHLLVGVVIFIDLIMILIVGIGLKSSDKEVILFLTFISLFSIAVVGTTAWVAKDEFTEV